MIEAAPLQGVVDLARAVGSDDDDRRLSGTDGAKFRNGHLEIREDLEQERLEGFIGAVEFVDQEHRRPSALSAKSPEVPGAE